MLQVIFEKVHPAAIIPTKATPGAACWDVYSVEDATVEFGKVTIVDCGFKVKIPQGYEIVVRPRSGLAFKHGITIVNSPGTLDEDYRGPVKIAFTSVNQKCVLQPMFSEGDKIQDCGHYLGMAGGFKISKGDRVAQIALKKVESYEFVEGIVETDTERAENGLGSTGK